MRIVYYLPDIDAGVSRIVINLLRFRPKNPAIKYTVVLIRCKTITEKPITEKIPADEVIHFTYEEEENAFHVLKRLKKTLNSDKDIIVGNDGLEIKMVATEKLNNPVAYIVHGDFPSYYLLVGWYYPVMNCIIAYSNKIEKTIKEIGGVDPATVHKIYYPADIKPLVYRHGEKNDSGFKIVFAGSTIERKGADLLPKIYDQLISLGMNKFELQIIGDGELLPSLKARFHSCSNVSFNGWRDQHFVRNAMLQADIFLFPSRLEGLPNVVVEALAAGAVPVVTDLESGISDIIKHEYNGMLVEKDNVKMFADSIFRLYNNGSLLQCLKLNALKSVNMFEPFEQAKAYEDLILKTVNVAKKDKRIFPSYKRGRVLDRSWLPNKMVFMLRKLIPEPRL